MIEQAIPQTFDDYIGQEKTKEALKIILTNLEKQIQQTIGNNRTLQSMTDASFLMPPSILIIGPPGYGKTRIAKIYAEQFYKLSQKNQWPIWAQKTHNEGKQVWGGPGIPNQPYFFAGIEGKDLVNTSILNTYLYYLQIYGVLFIDECHLIPKKIQDSFLNIMTDYTYYNFFSGLIEKHYGFTLIAATTHEHKLNRAFMERFKLIIHMEEYTGEELKKMAIQYCNKTGYSIDDLAAKEIVDRSRKNPRILTQIIDMTMMIKNNTTIEINDIIHASELKGIFKHGLTQKDIKILNILKENGVASAQTLCEMIDSVDIRNYKIIERYLINQNYIIPTNKGRKLTTQGEFILKTISEV